MAENVIIRRAVRDDVPEITRIYNYAIKNTTSTFDTIPKTLEDRYEWFEKWSDAYPLLVAECEGDVVAWASIRPFGTRTAYSYSVEDAIYVDSSFQGRGIGLLLLSALIDIAREKGYHAILGLIVGGNEASVKLHEKFGFEQVGLMRQVGRKFDKWLDVAIYEKILIET